MSPGQINIYMSYPGSPPPPPYANITGISRTVMKDNAQETLVNYNGNARPGEIVADLTTDPPALYIGNNLGELTAISSGSTYGNANVVTLLATFGSNAISTTGNITVGNISATANITTDDGYITGNNIDAATRVSGAFMLFNVSPLNNLPLANSAPGLRGFANDANLVAAGNFGAQITDGGSNIVPVWSDGSVWRIG